MLQPVDIYAYKNLTNYQEYISNEYCLVCAYFEPTKGHFGTCKDNDNKKVFDGAKKNTACGLWRLNKLYYNNRIKQVLPRKPLLKYNFKKCRVRPRNIMHQWIKPIPKYKLRVGKCRICGSAFAIYKVRKNKDLCRTHASSERLKIYYANVKRQQESIVEDYCI